MPLRLRGPIDPQTAQFSYSDFTSDPSSLGISDLGWGSTVLRGDYTETLFGLRAQPIAPPPTLPIGRLGTPGSETEFPSNRLNCQLAATLE